MKIVKQSHEVLYPRTVEEWLHEMKLIELAGRTAYKSEDKICFDSHKAFIKMIVQRGHLAVIEFGNMVVKFVTDRGISHELVRHRLCSFVQESTRYCNYSNNKFAGEITVIEPSVIGYKDYWVEACEKAEQMYLGLIADGNGTSAQFARSVLPNSLKTEIVIKTNFREWRHIFQSRAISKAAHPDMRALMLPLYQHCRRICPEVFEMGEPE